MSTDQLVAAVVGALMPALIAVVVRSTWPGWLKGVVAIGSSVVAASVTAFATGQFTTAKGWVETIVLVVAASQVMYRVWWQPSGIGPAIERATEPTKP